MYEHVRTNVSMRQHTTFHIGGKADKVVTVYNTDALINAYAKGGLILGKGSNVLIADGGVRGTVIINCADSLKLYEDGCCICEVDSGYSLIRLANYAAANELSGLEFACSIPGSVGGAIKMNAGAFGGCLGDCVQAVQVYSNGKLSWIDKSHCGFTYRGSNFGCQDLIVKARLKFIKSNASAISALSGVYRRERATKQPSGYSAGSIFKAADKAAGYYIDKANLKGFRVGDARISEKHANFIINKGLALAQDVKTIINTAKAIVYDMFGVKLVEEIQFLGDY